MFHPISHFHPSVVDESPTLTKASVYKSHLYYQCNNSIHFICTPKKYLFPLDDLFYNSQRESLELKESQKPMVQNISKDSIHKDAKGITIQKDAKGAIIQKDAKGTIQSENSKVLERDDSHIELNGKPEIRLNDRTKYIFWIQNKEESLGPYKIDNMLRCIAVDDVGVLQCYASYQNEWVFNGELNLFDQEKSFIEIIKSFGNGSTSSGEYASRDSKDSKDPKESKSSGPFQMLLKSHSKPQGNAKIPKGPAQDGTPLRIKHACIVSDSILIVHRTDNTVVAYILSFDIKNIPGRQTIKFGTEKEYIFAKNVDVSKFVVIHQPQNLEGAFRSSYSIDWNEVEQIRSAKEGIWIFTNSKIYYMSLFSLINEFHAKFSKQISESFPITNVHNGFNRIQDTAQPNNNNTENIENSENIQNAEISEKSVNYISFCVHGTSKELITLDSSGILRVYSISPVMRTKVVMKTIIFDELRIFVSKYIDNNQSNDNSKSISSGNIVLIPTSNHFLIVMSRDKCLLFAPKMKVFFGEIHIPTEVIYSKHDSKLMNFENIVWDSGSSQNGFGIFSKDKIYVFDPPSLREIIQKRNMLSESVQSVSKKEFAEFLKEYGNENWFVKLYLEIMMLDEKRGGISRSTKRGIMELLCSHLENPALVWSSSTSLSDQSQIIDKVEGFLNRFPKKTSQGLEKSKNHSAKENFQSMTWLNLSVVPKLSESVLLAKEMLSVKRDIPISTEKPELLVSLTDIELNEMFETIQHQLLVELCKKYGLEFLLSKKADYIAHLNKNEHPSEHVMKAALLNVEIPTATAHVLISKFSSTFHTLQSQDGDHAKQENEQLLKGFSHMDLLIRCLFHSEFPYKLSLFVLLLEKIQLQMLEEMKKEMKGKALDLAQKKEFQLLQEKDYRAHFSETVINILTLHEEIPYLNSDLKPIFIPKELKHLQIMCLGQILGWAKFFIRTLKLYLFYDYKDQALSMLDLFKDRILYHDQAIITQILYRYYILSCSKRDCSDILLEKIHLLLQDRLGKTQIHSLEQIDIIEKLSSNINIPEDPILSEGNTFTLQNFAQFFIKGNGANVK